MIELILFRETEAALASHRGARKTLETLRAQLPEQTEDTAALVPLLVDLKTALNIAVNLNRNYLDRKDTLYKKGLFLP